MSGAFHVTYLKKEFERRTKRNAAYSLRSYAKALGTDIGTLSRVLAGKRNLSVETAERISRSLRLTENQTQTFLTSVRAALELKGASRLPDDDAQWQSDGVNNVASDLFHVIADWYHISIAELTRLPAFQASPRWIARELGITVIEAEAAIARLVRLGFLKRDGKTLVKTQPHIATSQKQTTNEALKQYHKQILDKAKESMFSDPIDERNMTGMTFAIDPASMPLAKDMIQEFSRRLCRVLEADEPKRLYQLSINLFPLQRRSKK